MDIVVGGSVVIGGFVAMTSSISLTKEGINNILVTLSRSLFFLLENTPYVPKSLKTNS